MSPHATILIIEDNPTTAETLGVFLKAAHYGVEWARDGEEGLQRCLAAGFDLILLDIMLPGLDGLSLCRRVREHTAVPIVMLTAKTTEDDIVEGLEAGANDYVCKPFGSKELLARIRRCLRPPTSGPEMRECSAGEILVNLDTRTVSLKNRPIKLTRSEFEILAMLVRSPGRVFTRDQIIEQALGGANFDGYDRTVDTHIWSLRRKLGEPRGAPRYVLSEPGIGYRLQDSEQ